MRTPESPKWRFGQTPSGLFIPTGIVLGNTPAPFIETIDSDPDLRAARALGVVPTYEDLWDTPRPHLNDLLRRVPTQLWIGFLSRLSAVLCRNSNESASQRALLLEIFREPQRRRMLDFLNATQPAFPLAEFPVLLLIEIAASRSRQAHTQPTELDNDSLEVMVQAIYCVWSELSSVTDTRIRGNPAGIAAALNERSILGSPMQRLMTAFGLWVWDHKDLDGVSRSARHAFDGHLAASIGMSLSDWVTGIALATLIVQLRPLVEAATHPVIFQPDRSDLTAHGRDLLLRSVQRLAVTEASFQDQCREFDLNSDLLANPSLLPIKRTPCLHSASIPQGVYPISAIHLAEAAVERPLVERSSLAIHRAKARTEFGAVVECYVHGLLRLLFDNRYQRLPAVQDRKRAEGVIWCPSGFIVVECKARRPSELIRYQGREDSRYLDELVGSGLRAAVAQVHSTTQDILDGTIPHPGQLSPAIAGSLIVFLQDVPLSAVARSVLDRLLPASTTTNGVIRLRPQVISLARLEELGKWSHIDLLSVLSGKMRDNEVDLECLVSYLTHEGHIPRPSPVRRALGMSLRNHVRPFLAS
jgi:hypothetical protein